MMPGQNDPNAFADLFGIGAQTIVENALRLGLIWRMRMGTVTSVSTSGEAEVRLDADDLSIPVVSMIGFVNEDDRVYVITVPPAGNFMVGAALASRPMEIVSRYWVPSTDNLTLTTAAQLIPGTAITPTINGDFEWEASGVFDFECSTAGNTVCVGELFIDGVVASTSQALYEVTAATDRATVIQQWGGTSTSGSHTFDIRGRKSINVATVTARVTHTTFALRIYR
jgi:hypothetical protein